ncbi:uncharacterized protein LY89DRAFT_687922 [Mollisia scopiformis]|uniref:Uncharacterized protein n=1 Tax=Mollisia scopiformis TaxID=149040 RepID=A0A194WYK1_MOLSC|nr:uncharacterized protein LY89DRAFT_687922 [Mollisia scopiformis]KUJ13038.1 hypothetical protein LY89DRAFT_687922 [Mollisia scopiformis]
MQLSTLTPSLLYALLSLNPAAVNTLAGFSSTSTTSNTTPLRQDTYIPPATNLLTHRSLLSHRRRQELPTGLVNATVTCRDGEFQNPDDDIAAVVCGQYYKCGDGEEAEQVQSGTGEVVWSAVCEGCVAGQASDKVSGCVWTEM